MNCKVGYNLMSLSIVVAEAFSQETSYERSFEHGSLLRILPSTITLHATHITMELQCGLYRAENSTSGRRTDRYYGFVAIVCLTLHANLS
jgi:hypothetical protein